MSEERCPKTGKLIYKFQAHADKRVQHWIRQGGQEQFPYKCEHCPYWHLTKIRPEPREEVMRFRR